MVDDLKAHLAERWEPDMLYSDEPSYYGSQGYAGMGKAQDGDYVKHEEFERLRQRFLGLVRRISKVLSDNGCDCECDHDAESHEDSCERCLACRVEAAMRDAPLFDDNTTDEEEEEIP